MDRVDISGVSDPGETTDEKTNEDFLWISRDYSAVLILDGTSGTRGDFGAGNGKTGGRNYVEKFSANVEKTLQEDPDKDLEHILKTAVSKTWDDFQQIGEKKRKKYLSGEDATYATAETVPGAVGCMVRWTDEEVKIVHVGDVETYIVKENDTDFLSNSVHQKYDQLYEKKIRELSEKGVENPSEDEEVWKLVHRHRSASNMPGNYPQFQFNPLVVEKLGEKKRYDREKVEKILLGTDGATARIRELFDLEKTEVPEYIGEKGVEKALEELREKENSENLDKLKNSDDAAMALLEF